MMKTDSVQVPGEEASFDDLVNELIQIGKEVKNRKDSSSGYLYLDFRRNTQKHPRAHKIGELLNERGGIELMRKAHSVVRERLGKIPARELEVCWGYIGDWLP
jgi:hypothetical protein